MNNKKTIAYICHPVSGNISKNLTEINLLVWHINKEYPHIMPFVPYFADCIALNDNIKEERERGMANSSVFIERKFIDELWICSEIISAGMKQEIELAKEMKIPVVNMANLLESKNV